MTLVAGLAIYAVIWWIVLFAVLPWGVVSQHEKGAFAPGTEAGAPVRPMMWRKAAVTTVIAAVIWAAIAYVVIYHPVVFDDLPFMPKLDRSY